jgi:peptide/nickel transport system substrate-binding protein
MMELEAYPDYFHGKPRIAGLVLQFLGTAGLNELLSGNADIVLNADSTQIPTVLKDSRFRVYHSVNPSGDRVIYWKCDHSLFTDTRVRRALTMAIDRRALLRLLNLPADLVPVTDGVFTRRQFWRRQIPDSVPHDLAQSRALLDAAGWQYRNGEGVRERGGMPFRFTAIVRNDQAFDRMAVYVQAHLRQVDVQMDIQVLDPGVVQGRLNAGNFEALFGGFSSNPVTQRRYLTGNNTLGYRNPEYGTLLAQVMATAESDELDRLYGALTDVLRADLPLTRLVPVTNTTFAHRRVQGLSTPFSARADTNMEDLWLENEA